MRSVHCHPLPSVDPDYESSIQLLLENTGPDNVELKAFESYAQLIPLKYYQGPVLGARDYHYRSERGDGCFGPTESRQRLQEMMVRRLEEGDLEDPRVAEVLENATI